MANPPFDPYGNPVPAVPGYNRIIDSDGNVIQQRNVLRLGTGITATDDGVDATVLDSGGISGATAAGIAMVQAEDADAQRTLLGLSDITDLRSHAIARANALCGFTKKPRVWHGDPFPTPLTTASVWANKAGSGSVTRVGTGADCGSFDVAGTGTYALLGRTEDTSSVDQVVSDVIGTRWYMCYLFKCNTGAVAGSDMGMGLQGKDTTYTEFVVLGVNHTVSSTKFALQRFSTNSVLSSVSIDTTNWHLAETWSNPDTDANAVFGSIDGESAIKLDGIAPFSQSAGPWIHVYSAGGAQSMRFADAFVVVEGRA